jgi:hypothetical protein
LQSDIFSCALESANWKNNNGAGNLHWSPAADLTDDLAAALVSNAAPAMWNPRSVPCSSRHSQQRVAHTQPDEKNRHVNRGPEIETVKHAIVFAMKHFYSPDWA